MVVVPYFHAMRTTTTTTTPYSCLSVLQIVCLGHLFYTRKFSSYLQDDLVRPKGVQTIEKHAKHKHNILKVPGKTCLTRRILGMVVRRLVNTKQKVGTHEQSYEEKHHDEASHVDGQCRFGKKIGSYEIQVNG
jgi:hypothetical protein